MINITENHIKGARNLLINCAELKSGDKLLIVSEQSDLGWYDGHSAEFIAIEAEKMGINQTLTKVGSPKNFRSTDLIELIEKNTVTIFFSRIGDQERFSQPKDGTRIVMCYIRDMDMLSSPFGTTNYNAFKDFKNAVDDILFNAKKIEISCPLGSNFSGALPKPQKKRNDNDPVRRFPLGVHEPIEAKTFSGQVALDRYLAPTGSRVYEPDFLKLSEPIIAEIKLGRIKGFTGQEDQVKKVKEHYNQVANKFNIDPTVVHSWHAGIHPGSNYKVPESDNPDRWSNTVFSQPDYIHFHTCGDYAPGEISCTNHGHTIKVNGMPLWNKGVLFPNIFENTKTCMDTWPELKELFN